MATETSLNHEATPLWCDTIAPPGSTLGGRVDEKRKNEIAADSPLAIIDVSERPINGKEKAAKSSRSASHPPAPEESPGQPDNRYDVTRPLHCSRPNEEQLRRKHKSTTLTTPAIPGSLLSNLMQNQFPHASGDPPRPSARSHTQSSPAEKEQSDEEEDNYSSPPVSTVPGPSSHDIVCGRGMFMYHHPGSVRFRQIVRNATPYYEVADSRSLKAIVIKIVLEQIFECCGADEDLRFLKFDSSTKRWIALSDAQIRDKVGHALRDSVLEIQRDETGVVASRSHIL